MKTLVFVTLSALLLLTTTCKKYPDDSKNPTKTAMKRIAKGWKVTQMTIDDADSSSRLYYGYFHIPAREYVFTDLSIKFKKEKNPDGKSPDVRAVSVSPSGVAGSNTAAWNFTSGKDRIIFYFDNGDNNTNSFKLNVKSQQWKILSLTNDQLIIETIEAKRKIKLTLH